MGLGLELAGAFLVSLAEEEDIDPDVRDDPFSLFVLALRPNEAKKPPADLPDTGAKVGARAVEPGATAGA